VIRMHDPRGSPRLFEVIAMAASAGGHDALCHVLAALPATFPLPIVIVQHLDPHHPSHLAHILARSSALAVKQAEEAEHLRAGTVYVAPPNHHVLINEDGTLSLTQTQLVHFLRPSADLMFSSLARAFASRAIAVVLTGTGADGASGVEDVKKMGGTVLVQDQATSKYFGMPGAAIRTGCADFVLPLDHIGSMLISLVASGGAP
jgi:two-component system chemotaxis response regulator CheB